MFGAIAGSLIGGMMNQQSQARTNRTNIRLARESNQFSALESARSRNFQERMSNTSHQRQVSDMKKAGLNPMLSATQGGASTPAGASGSASMARTESSRAGDALGQAVSTALDSKRLKKEIAATDSQISLNKASRLTQTTQQELNNSSAVEANARVHTEHLKQREMQSQIPAIDAEARARTWEADARQEEAKYIRDKSKLDRKLLKTDAILNRASQALGIGNSARSLRRINKGKK